MRKTLQRSIFSRLNIKDVADTFSDFQIEFVLVLIVLVTTSLLIFFLTHYVIPQKENIIDYRIFLLVKQIISPAGLKAAKILTLLGTGNFLVPAYIFIIIYLEKRNYRCLIYLTVVTAVSSLSLGWLLKWVFHRQPSPGTFG